MLANRAADPERGCGAFDVNLPVKLAQSIGAKSSCHQMQVTS
jgi:hypothetical protein